MIKNTASLFLIVIFFLLSPTKVFSAQNTYSFSTPAEKERFHTLTSGLRCLVCQNETVAESNATLASDLRDKIYSDMRAGKTDQQIVDYLVSRYGNFIRYQPPLSHATFLLWFGPLIFLITGMILLGKHIRRKS